VLLFLFSEQAVFFENCKLEERLFLAFCSRIVGMDGSRVSCIFSKAFFPLLLIRAEKKNSKQQEFP
jgi:hypothetical protein